MGLGHRRFKTYVGSRMRYYRETGYGQINNLIVKTPLFEVF
jgi:hypothetical protein